MDQQGAQIAVAAFADPQQCLLATAGMLAWYQSQLRRQLSAILKIFCVSDGGEQGTRGDQPPLPRLQRRRIHKIIHATRDKGMLVA